jgi:hypothetical protein
MPEEFVDITSIFVDSEGAGRFYLSTKIVEKQKIQTGDHFKVIVDNRRIIYEKVK